MNIDAVSGILSAWVERGWLRPLDRALARFFQELAPQAAAPALLGAALVSHQLGRGHICLDLGAVLAGAYQVYVGTDNDNDGLICDPGEACGAWPTLYEPYTFVHARDRDDILVSVGYARNLVTLSSTPSAIPAGIPHRAASR